MVSFTMLRTKRASFLKRSNIHVQHLWCSTL
uniref:Uncharacterized protein n=1 Tax=Anguilla anguilla TaxID=7936 RepID=A0A0E9QSS0_ANGAN